MQCLAQLENSATDNFQMFVQSGEHAPFPPLAVGGGSTCLAVLANFFCHYCCINTNPYFLHESVKLPGRCLERQRGAELCLLEMQQD